MAGKDELKPASAGKATHAWSHAPYEDVTAPRPAPAVPRKAWQAAGRSHLGAAERIEAADGSVLARLGMRRDPRAVRLRDRAQAAQRTAKALAPLSAQGWVVLHDRVVAGTSTGLDHVLVGPPGVVVVQDRPTAQVAINTGGQVWADGVPLAPECEHVRWATVSLLLPKITACLGQGWTVYAWPVIALHTRPWEPFLGAPASLLTPGQLTWAIGTWASSLAPMHVTDLAMVVEDQCPPATV